MARTSMRTAQRAGPGLSGSSGTLTEASRMEETCELSLGVPGGAAGNFAWRDLYTGSAFTLRLGTQKRLHVLRAASPVLDWSPQVHTLPQKAILSSSPAPPTWSPGDLEMKKDGGGPDQGAP